MRAPSFCMQAHLDLYLSAQEQLNASTEVMQRMEALLMAPGVEEVMAARRMYSLQVQVWEGQGEGGGVQVLVTPGLV